MNGIFLFDFDGTLCDSFPSFVAALNHDSFKFKFNKIEPEEADRLKEMSSVEVLRHLGITTSKLPFVVSSLRKHMLGVIDTLKAFPEIATVVGTLRERGNKIGCITSNSKDLVTRWLIRENIPMDVIVAGSSIFGKARLIRKVVKSLGQSAEPAGHIYYAGDERRDLEAVNKAEVQSVAVGWGFNSAARLSRDNPDHLCQTPRDLLNLK